jgi:O-antigen/teichoic acid export membrane protein
LTSVHSVLAAFAIILIDLLSKAGLDKVLAYSGGPSLVALWAQLQSVVDLVSAVAITGVIQGLTVMVAQAHEPRDERSILRTALTLSLGTSLTVALIVVLAAPVLAAWLTLGKIAVNLFWFAAVAGCVMVLPATLNAYWLGKHQQQRMLGLSLLTGGIWLLVAAGAWRGLTLHSLILLQIAALAVICIAIGFYLHKLSRPGEQHEGSTKHFGKLARFVPVGLAIGIMSPASMLLIRGVLSGTLSWDDVGILQALWRASDWVTATAAGMFSLVFLPRFSAAYGSAQFKREIFRAGVIVLLPSATLLLLIYIFQRGMLETLYDKRFSVNDSTAALFMLGSWLRIASWLFLFGLFAAHRTKLIVAGEVLSLPLFAMLMWLFANGMTLERAALLYLTSYVFYLGYNVIGLLYLSRKTNG